jgi:hypothetical protein
MEVIEAFSQPYPHFLANRIFELSYSLDLLAWLRGAAPWRLHSEIFFEQWECNLSAELDGPGRLLFGSSNLSRLRSGMEQMFQVKLDAVEIAAHKLKANQSIGIHNDDPMGRERGETHRLIVGMVDDYEDTNGGLFGIFKGSSNDSLCRLVRPLLNSAVAMELSSRSYHAVSEVRARDRYTIVFSFFPR